MLHPVANPVTSLPRRRRARKPWWFSPKNQAYVIINHPEMVGIPPIMRAGWRPSFSAAGYANSPPKIAPRGKNACRIKLENL